jgi:hypothetical protein
MNKETKNRIIEAIATGSNFVYNPSGWGTIQDAFNNNWLTATREQAESLSFRQYQADKPSDKRSFETLFNNGDLWIWDLKEELNISEGDPRPASS